jgi:hypothetical protein
MPAISGCAARSAGILFHFRTVEKRSWVKACCRNGTEEAPAAILTPC